MEAVWAGAEPGSVRPSVQLEAFDMASTSVYTCVPVICVFCLEATAAVQLASRCNSGLAPPSAVSKNGCA